MNATSEIRITELEIPARVGERGWDDFATAIAIHYGNEALVYGTDELAFTAEETLPNYLDQEHEPTRLFAAWDGKRMVGAARYEIEPGDDPHTSWLMVDVLPGVRQQGIGTALSAKLQGVAATDGIRKAIVYTVSGFGQGQQLCAPTGFGSVAADNSEVKFLLRAGYRLEQVVRASRLPLPAPGAETMLARSRVAAGDDFVLHTWVDRTPKKWRREMAAMHQAMSVEEPTAGLEEPEDVWTIRRLDETEKRLAGGPRRFLVTAVEHVPSATLAGFTTLSVPTELDRPVTQEDTLVLPAYRGHRLGMLLKAANLEELRQRFDPRPSVITFNAEENRHMLNVNEQLGFAPIGYEGAWRRDLPN
ncbi:MAG TPA: GNAT family N-acetyltransferase [Galbitalea sp.]|nr:GNAT family N-acetyltransferase [Galbitalea sp.]